MATAKKTPAKRKKSTSATKLCRKVIKREGINAKGQLKPGYKWAAGGGRAVKVTKKPTAKKPATKKPGLKGATKRVCVRTNDDGSTTTYSAQGNSRPCPFGGNIVKAALNGVKKKAPAKKKPAAKKKAAVKRK